MAHFQDQSHIDQVRDALWRKGGNGASVMVGSGLSRCAVSVRPNATLAPMLSDLALEIHERLYPGGIVGGPQAEGLDATGGDRILSLAQEYETAFERVHLHQLLLDLLRDDDLKPGETHSRLLQLPWRDVFTTNWDTLLERTRPQVLDRAYSVVRDIKEIPLASRPRIVKLHGSLPAQFPLILTEEDYRTYPANFAPFVNTVQQAMMETVFCLIGFSGNDPNFLKWSGWVRDNLGVSAPRIYLAGWLGLSDHRRRMLESRGVVPIDLAGHPKASDWPEHQRHHQAIEWVLHTLENGRPYDFTYWPSPSGQVHLPVPKHLEPVARITSKQPRQEPTWQSDVGSEPLQERVQETLCIWEHNRELYPGWLTLPSGEEREMFVTCTDNWEPMILESFPSVAPLERLNAIRELVWRREVLLEPISKPAESAAVEALQSIDCQSRTIDGIAEPACDWGAVRESWRTVALALLGAARLRFDDDLFEERAEALGPFVDDHPDVAQRLHQERCLRAVYSMDFDALKRLLDAWKVDDVDAMWKVRKAALLSELDLSDSANGLVKDSLAEIRSISDAEGRVAGASREGWAMWSAFSRDKRHEFRKRWDELGAVKCDALLERDLIARRISGTGRSREAPTFDLGTRRGERVHFSNEAKRLQDAAFRAILLSEVVGLPPVISAEMLKLAAVGLSSSAPELSVRLVLRACTYENDTAIQKVLSRTQVALLPDESVRQLAKECTLLIEHGLIYNWVQRVRVGMEVLSRLVLRLDPESALATFDKALGFCTNRHDKLLSNVLVFSSLRNLLRRSWQALPPDYQSGRVLSILNAPIVGVDGTEAQFESRRPDPGILIGRSSGPLLPERTSANEDVWQSIVRGVIAGLRANGPARGRAAKRLLPVVFRNILTDDEVSRVAKALWANEQTSEDGLPNDTGLYDWVFLVLPEPQPGIGEELFRLKWLTSNPLNLGHSGSGEGGKTTVSFPYEPSDPQQLEDTLWNLGNAFAISREHGADFKLSPEEGERVLTLISVWAQAGIPSRAHQLMPGMAIQPTLEAIEGLASILKELDIPQRIGEELFEKVKRLAEAGIPSFILIHGLVKVLPTRVDELLAWLRMGFVSDDDDLAASAMACLRTWLTASLEANVSVPPPPTDLLREVGFIVASRRQITLPQALHVAKWVFDEGTPDYRESISGLVIQGLDYLAEELRYDRERDPDERVDLPLLRWLCIRLAQSMAQSGFREEPTVELWLELGRNDPLPEARYLTDL